MIFLKFVLEIDYVEILPPKAKVCQINNYMLILVNYD
jgi:hypothetical protein